MGWFGPKLEPGERIVLRYPPVRQQIFRAIVVPALYVPVMVGPPLLFIPGVLRAAPAILSVGALTLIGFGILGFKRYSWHSAVTNSRVVLRSRNGTTGVESMSIEDIAVIERETIVPKLIMRGGGRELAIRCDPEEADGILAALDRPGWDDLPLHGTGWT
jgi:hypothetical protein